MRKIVFVFLLVTLFVSTACQSIALPDQNKTGQSPLAGPPLPSPVFGRDDSDIEDPEHQEATTPTGAAQTDHPAITDETSLQQETTPTSESSGQTETATVIKREHLAIHETGQANEAEQTEETDETEGNSPEISIDPTTSESFADSRKSVFLTEDEQLIISQFEGRNATLWGEKVTGVKTRIKTDDRVIALTFDACGSSGGPEFDEKLIQFLIDEQIPATMFFSGRWIDTNQAVFLELAENPLFEVANHGNEHRPLSISGRSAYGIKGTQSVEEVFHEIQLNQKRIERLTGHRPRFFRSGTAYYDEVAVEIIYALGATPVNYSVLGDAGATYNEQQIYQSMMKAKNGSIILFHMNKPGSDVAMGVARGALELRRQGYTFVQLGDYAVELE